MIERRRLTIAPEPEPVATVETLHAGDKDSFITSGSFLFDKMLGGGWGRGRIVNIVGDKSAGKTLLAIELLAGVASLSSAAQCRYAEAEAAFDLDYGRVLGFPRDLEPFSDARTVEDFYKDLTEFLKKQKHDIPSAYVLDSLDALSDDAEADRALGEATYGVGKAKILSEMFRRSVKDISTAGTVLMIISQIRDKIGVMFGEKTTRSGGRALDFYSSQIVWLTETGKIKRTVGKIERVIGVDVKARTKKNKSGIPFRDVELQIIFGYGIDDEASMIDWLKSAGVISPQKQKVSKTI